MSETDNQRELRVGAAEREHVVGVLRKAAERGLLDSHGLTGRVAAARAATTRGELNAVLVDLPGAEAAPERVELTGAVRRDGEWTVPRELLVRNRWRRAELDFTRARFPHHGVRIELDCTGGAVELRVPHGAGVDVDSVACSWGATVEDQRRNRTHLGTPHLVVTGRLRCAPLVVRGPS